MRVLFQLSSGYPEIIRVLALKFTAMNFGLQTASYGFLSPLMLKNYHRPTPNNNTTFEVDRRDEKLRIFRWVDIVTGFGQ